MWLFFKENDLLNSMQLKSNFYNYNSLSFILSSGKIMFSGIRI